MQNRITPARLKRAFDESMTFQDFLGIMKVNRGTIEDNYAAHRLSESDLALVRQPAAPLRILALVHDWCGDVVANLPILARFEERGLVELCILEKNPQNTDLGALYPHPSGEVHIPIYIAFDAEGMELGHFIERSEAMNTRLGSWIKDFWAARPGHPESGKGFDELSEKTRTELLGWIGRQRSAVRAEERREFIDWFNSLQG